MVTNVAVVTELEQLEARLGRDESKLTELSSSRVLLEKDSKQRQQTLHKAEAALAVRQRRLDERIEEGRMEGKMFSRIVIEQQQAMQKVEAARNEEKDVQSKLMSNEKAQTKLKARMQKATRRQKKLESRKTIREVDTGYPDLPRRGAYPASRRRIGPDQHRWSLPPRCQHDRRRRLGSRPRRPRPAGHRECRQPRLPSRV